MTPHRQSGYSMRRAGAGEIARGFANVTVSFRVILSIRSGGEMETAIYIQALFRQIGVQMQIDTLDAMAQYPRVVTGDYEAAIRGIGVSQFSGDSRYLPQAGYSNPRFRELADQLEMAIDPDQKDHLFIEMAKLFQQDVPATALYPRVLTTIATNRLHGLDGSPYPGDLTWCMDELTLEEQN
jgi:ABC-type transport system substrate-binding protein